MITYFARFDAVRTECESFSSQVRTSQHDFELQKPRFRDALSINFGRSRTLGERISGRLKIDINGAELVIGLIGPETANSRYVLFELPVIRPRSRIYLNESPVNITRLLTGNSAGLVRDLRGHKACKR